MARTKLPNVLILGVQVPFTRGGAELLIERLRDELDSRGYPVDIVQLPFAAVPNNALVHQMALWRSLDLTAFAGREVDIVIPTKFPSYLAPHHCKRPWIIHQHRQLYELYGSRYGDFTAEPIDESLRRMVFRADSVALAECERIFTISQNVSERLERYLGVQSTPLLPPPPLAGAYYSGEKQRYLLSVGRLCSIKRVDMAIRAMAHLPQELTLKIVGQPDEPAIKAYLQSEVEKHHLWGRVEFLGRVEKEELLKLFAEAFAVYYAPFDEDFGFVTLESLLSGTPVITTLDSGTVLEFVGHERNGLIAEPNEQAIATQIQRLLDDADLYRKVAVGAAQPIPTLSWDTIVDELMNPSAHAAAKVGRA